MQAIRQAVKYVWFWYIDPYYLAKGDYFYLARWKRKMSWGYWTWRLRYGFFRYVLWDLAEPSMWMFILAKMLWVANITILIVWLAIYGIAIYFCPEDFLFSFVVR